MKMPNEPRPHLEQSGLKQSGLEPEPESSGLAQFQASGAKHSNARGLWSLAARFFSGGAACFALNLAIIRVGTEILHLHYLLVFSVSWLLVLMLGFAIHRHWTFRSTSGAMGPQFARYVAANASQIAISYPLMWALVSRLGLMPWKASCAIAVIFAVFNFFIHKNWSFAPETR